MLPNANAARGKLNLCEPPSRELQSSLSMFLTPGKLVTTPSLTELLPYTVAPPPGALQGPWQQQLYSCLALQQLRNNHQPPAGGNFLAAAAAAAAAAWSSACPYGKLLVDPRIGPPHAMAVTADTANTQPKPQHSYIGLIAMAILSSAERKLVLSDIYQYILDNYSYFRSRGTGWRNSIRHNLSLNDCFVKAGRSPNGKGHFWAIHPANERDFSNGDFRRRKAQRRVRRHMGLLVEDDEDSMSPPPPLAAPALERTEGPLEEAAAGLKPPLRKRRQFDVASLLAPDVGRIDALPSVTGRAAVAAVEETSSVFSSNLHTTDNLNFSLRPTLSSPTFSRCSSASSFADGDCSQTTSGREALDSLSTVAVKEEKYEPTPDDDDGDIEVAKI